MISYVLLIEYLFAIIVVWYVSIWVKEPLLLMPSLPSLLSQPSYRWQISVSSAWICGLCITVSLFLFDSVCKIYILIWWTQQSNVRDQINKSHKVCVHSREHFQLRMLADIYATFRVKNDFFFFFLPLFELKIFNHEFLMLSRIYICIMCKLLFIYYFIVNESQSQSQSRRENEFVRMHVCMPKCKNILVTVHIFASVTN